MKSRHGALWFALALFGSCNSVTSTGIDDTSARSGVEGRVVIGPTCPIETDEDPCPDEPFQALLTVTLPGGTVVARSRSDAEGNFRIPLSPGDYVLQPESPTPNGPPFAAHMPFQVIEATWTRLTVRYDSGLR